MYFRNNSIYICEKVNGLYDLRNYRIFLISDNIRGFFEDHTKYSHLSKEERLLIDEIIIKNNSIDDETSITTLKIHVSNVKIIIQDSNNVKAPEYSHTPGRIYAIVKEGQLKHVAYYDEEHRQAVSIDLAHPHNGVQPHRHEYLRHNKKDPGVPPTAEEEELIKKIKKEYHLK